jgi:acetylornithine/N-succinyldiaminopimelate aminotransferase
VKKQDRKSLDNGEAKESLKHILKCYQMIKPDIVRGENCYLYDSTGKKYVDFESGLWCAALGHNNRRINEAVKKQIGLVMNLGYRYTNLMAEDAAVALLETADLPDGRCVFLSSGSEAVEFAVQIAKIITGDKYLLIFSQSYLAAYGAAGNKYSDEWVGFDFEGCLSCRKKDKCDVSCEKIRNIPFETIGAVVFELGSACGTVKFPPAQLADLIAGEIKRRGGLIVVDEVTTGMGRTGKWYGFNHYGFKPDIVAVGKGLGNGYPVSAVAMNQKAAKELEERNFGYGQSHQNSPLGCAVAKEVISVLKEERLIERSCELGKVLLGRLNELKDKYGFIREVRGRGLMVGVELFGDAGGIDSEYVRQKMLDRGFMIGCNKLRNVLLFLPALTIEEKEITNLITNLNGVFGGENCTGGG